MAIGYEPFDKMGADEPSTTCYENFHLILIPLK